MGKGYKRICAEEKENAEMIQKQVEYDMTHELDLKVNIGWNDQYKHYYLGTIMNADTARYLRHTVKDKSVEFKLVPIEKENGGGK